MQASSSKLRKYMTAMALGEVVAMLAGTLTMPVGAQNQIAMGKPAASRAHSANTASAPAADKTAFKKAEGSGTLVAMLPGGKTLGQCALKHTDVNCEIAGYISRVTVKQTFHNPFKNKIEALYTFPLSDSGAVDEMVMKVGDRTIHGTIKKREEARQLYERARANGQVASLLDQERTNIFNQSVANIEPGKEIEITIKYVETLPYENGKYTFAFPTVVGPRFIPGNATGQTSNPGNWGHDTDEVPDASLITPPVVQKGERSGHDLSLTVHLNAGLPVSDLDSKLHAVNITDKNGGKATISLVDKNTIANKDFVLSWAVAQNEVKSGYLTYREPGKDGYFTLMLMPPKKVAPSQIAPKEMIFVIDCSGSQSGPPLDKCKETMNYILDHMNPDDTFQIIAFNNQATTFASQPQKVSEAMKEKAHKFISELQANGGTWMAPAVEAACKIPADSHRLRIVTFMTDGFVGNDFEIMGMIKKYRNTSRWFPFGTGNNVNRMLIDGIAQQGGGEPDYVLLNTSGKEAGKKFYDRISTPVLTDVKLTFEGVKVKEVYPREISDVWAEKPLYFKGKYTAGGAGTVTMTGFRGGKAYEQKLAVNFPEDNKANPGIASLWARAKVDHLMAEDLSGAQRGAVNKELKEEIVETALAHHIMTQYTSFIAVDEKTVVKDGKLQTVTVPVEIPDGVDREKIFGKDAEQAPMASPSMLRGAASGGGFQALNKMAYPMSSPAPSGMIMYGNAAGAGGSLHSSRRASLSQAANGFSSQDKSLQIADATPTVIDYRRQGLAGEKAKVSITNAAKKEIGAAKDDLSAAINGPATVAGKPAEGETGKGEAAKLSTELQALTNTDKTIAVFVKTIWFGDMSAAQKKTLEALGFKLRRTGHNRYKQLNFHGTINARKLKQLAALDFISTISLDSDRK